MNDREYLSKREEIDSLISKIEEIPIEFWTREEKRERGYKDKKYNYYVELRLGEEILTIYPLKIASSVFVCLNGFLMGNYTDNRFRDIFDRIIKRIDAQRDFKPKTIDKNGSEHLRLQRKYREFLGIESKLEPPEQKTNP